MKRFLLWALACATAITVFAMIPEEASAQRSYCMKLRSRRAYYAQRYRTYRARYRNCRRRGWGYRGCRGFRNTYKMFRRSYRRARNNYRRWGCSRYYTWRRYDSGAYQAAKCRGLARRVNRWRAIRNGYLNRWRRCKWRRGSYSPKCRRLRARVNQWYANVRAARSNYSAWGCRFTWNSWSDPWAARRRRRAVYRARKCQRLANRVNSWRSIRNSYLRRWRRCRRYRGSYSPKCQRLRARVRQWYANVRNARSNYSAWGCRFGWNSWSDPWAARRRRRAVYRARKCQRLANRVNSWRSIRNSYLRRWRRCRRYRGSYSRKCRRLRRRVNQWYANVRAARRNYSAWGCRFGWNSWSDPWAGGGGGGGGEEG